MVGWGFLHYMKNLEFSGIILDAFVADHDTIRDFMRKFLVLQAKGSFDKPLFQKIKWDIERHIYLEEKTIFLHLEKNPEKDPQIASDLQAQHSEAMDLLAKMENSLSEGKEIDLIELDTLINGHINWELRTFYRMLDEELSDAEKEEINCQLQKSCNSGFFPILKLRNYYSKFTK